MSSRHECILLYNIQPASREQEIKSLLRRLDFPYKDIPLNAGGYQVGSFLGLKGQTDPVPDAAPLPGEMMILSGLSSLRLDTLLKAFRAAGIPPVALKAMVTETNVNWTLNTLFGHLLLEHRQMTNAR